MTLDIKMLTQFLNSISYVASRDKEICIKRLKSFYKKVVIYHFKVLIQYLRGAIKGKTTKHLNNTQYQNNFKIYDLTNTMQ